MSVPSPAGHGPAAAPVALSAPPGSRPVLGPALVELAEPVLASLRAACDRVETDDAACAEASRDWWPLALSWAAAGRLPARAGAVVRPASAGEVSDVLRVCQASGVPVTPAAGRSGVCGASIPIHGGVVIDMTGLSGLGAVDDRSLLVEVAAGTFGDDLEAALRASADLTVGHWPQSMELSTVGGWVACRGAGQYSTRYGKIEDMVVGLEAVLADGSRVRTGGLAPRAAAGPDLTQVILGSEGTLAVVTGALLRAHPVTGHEWRAAFGFDSFVDGLDACRRILRRGATPAVLRLYDQAESARSFGTGDASVLIVLDEGDPAALSATATVTEEECGPADRLDDVLVEQWLEHRNDVSALGALISRGYVVDTVEVAARWSALDGLYHSVVSSLRALDGTLAATAHQSHSYADGACLYFTFAARPPDAGPDGWAEHYYNRAWDTVMDATIAAGGAISHHHGIGLNRSRHLPASLGPAHRMLMAIKAALDPAGILNPGKLGLPGPWGAPAWP
ncbi:MAG TPA: FAD-binding oxidoreductase [Acidimicrobiales bacterium]|nr:FAD-binding oxidoreductase [Acidimicrobiales bacterium]